jgi:hypothetical protein
MRLQKSEEAGRILRAAPIEINRKLGGNYTAGLVAHLSSFEELPDYFFDAAMPWSMSAMMSSRCSMPTDNRINSGVMPPARCWASESWE